MTCRTRTAKDRRAVPVILGLAFAGAMLRLTACAVDPNPPNPHAIDPVPPDPHELPEPLDTSGLHHASDAGSDVEVGP
jgi:hypothetical protein